MKKDSIVVFKSEKYFVAEHKPLGIATQGLTKEEALENLKEAIRIHLKFSKSPRAG